MTRYARPVAYLILAVVTIYGVYQFAVSDWATDCPEYKVTAVQATKVSQPSEWQQRFKTFTNTQVDLVQQAKRQTAEIDGDHG